MNMFLLVLLGFPQLSLLYLAISAGFFIWAKIANRKQKERVSKKTMNFFLVNLIVSGVIALTQIIVILVISLLITMGSISFM